MSTTPQWQIIRPWAPSLCLTVREITSVSATFILSSTLSDRETDPSLASRGLIAAAEDSDLQETTEPVASSSAISSSLCTNEEEEESLKSQTRSFIADALVKGLSVTVNGSPWPRTFIRIDEQSDEAVIIVYALMPGRQYDVELGLIPNDQQSSNNNNDATITHLNSQITTEDDSDNTPSDIQSDPESPNLDHSIPSDPHSTPSTSPSPTVPGTPATVPHMTLEEKLKHFQQNLTAVNEERETLLASLKSIRKDSQKADSALRSEIDTLKRTSERHALAESKGRQKILALQEAVKRAQNATKEIEAKVKELEAEMPDLNKAKDEKENEYATLKKEAEKVRKEREVLEEKEKKRQEAVKADLAGLTVKLEKLGAKKEKMETGIVPELEQKLKEIEKEIEDEEQNLLKWNANAQNYYQRHQLKQQRQQQQRSFHTHNHSEDHHPTASSVPIQRPRYHSSEFPTPIGRPTLAPIQRPTQSDLASSNLVATSAIWAQRPLQPQSHSHHSQIPQRPPPTSQQTVPIYSPRLHQLNNPRSLSFHNSMVVSSSASSNLIRRRSSLKNPVPAPFSPTLFNTATTTTATTSSCSSGSSGSNTPGSSSFKSVTSSPTRSHASMVASSSTLSSKAPAFEPTGSISVISKLTGGGIIPNATMTPKLNPSATSPVMSKGKEAMMISRTSTVPTTPLPAPIQRPVARASSGSGSGNGNGRHRHSQWNYSGGF